MILFGKKQHLLKHKTPKEIICPKCNSANSTKVSVIGIYKHFIHIPYLSQGKSGASICTNCNETFSLQNMPNSIKLAYYELKESAKAPLWFYSGLIGIKVLVLIKIFSRYL
ncbi:MAG: hypothetical protein JJE44_09635 [Flavobacteriaceae bacterium]|nr:hypothetical protein [Flavobacteriaceae bacterium]